MSRLKDNRLYVFSDEIQNNSFIVTTSEQVFARINQISGKWIVWYYTKHLQEEFLKLKEALIRVDEEFVNFLQGKQVEIYKRTSI